jgi:predicted nucleotidyltransferase
VSHADIYDRFVVAPTLADSDTRQTIWEEYLDAQALLRSAVRVHAAWLSGSFLSGKVDPKDIDVVFLISGRDYAKADVEDKQVVDSFVSTVPGPLGEPIRAHGFARVDSFLQYWRPYDSPSPGLGQDRLEYCAYRGYWDDFWQRTRKGPKEAPPTWKDGIPARGYLEVVLDEFDR